MGELHLLHALIDLIPDPILVKDRQKKYVWGNRAKLKELGVHDVNEIIGKTAFDFFDHAVAESFKSDDDQVLRGEEVLNRREQVVEPNGAVRWHLTSKLPWRDGNGNIIGLMSISRNITDRVEAEVKLQDERNLLRTLIDYLPDAIYAKDAQARKILLNAADLKNLGCATEAEAVGKSDFDMFPKEIADAFFADDQSVLQGHPVINREEKLLSKSGEQRWLLTSKIPWRDTSGKIIGLVGIGRDITEKKNLEEQVAQARRMESVGRLATGIAHDLNNILTPILMSIELLRSKLHDSQYLEMLSKAETSAHRGADIIKQILWFSRGLTGQRGPINLPQLLGDIAQFATETYGKNIRVEKQIAGDLWTVNGDLAQLHQALINLCTNAREAMPVGGTLTIGARNATVEGNHFVILEVLDTGGGISPEVADRIFEPFFTTKSIGHGLGLSTVHSIVKSHGGFIKSESQPGKGAAFRIHLPAAL